MSDQTLRRLPYISVAALAAFAVCLAAVIHQKNAALSGPDTARPAVESVLEKVQTLHSSNADSTLERTLRSLTRAPHVAYVWGIGSDGAVFFSTARFAVGDRIEAHATAETRRLLAALPENYLSGDQRLAMLTASAMQSEGEHNDLFGYLVRPLRSDAGTSLGIVGVGYAMRHDGTPPLSYVIPLLLLPVSLAIYWLGLVGWVFLDARSRHEPAWIWGCFVLFGNLVALTAYLLVRPHASKAVG